MAMETMTTQQVCDYLGMSRRTLNARISAGEIRPLPGNPVLKKQPRNEFDRAAIEAYKEAAEKAALVR